MELNVESLAVLIVLVNSLVEVVKWSYQDGWKPERIIAIVASIALSILVKADAFVLIGMPLSVPYVGYVLTGLILSRGSNVFADLLSLVNVAKKVKVPSTAESYESQIQTRNQTSESG